MTKADLRLLAITALGGAFGIGIASFFEKSRAFMWRVAILPIPLAIALIIIMAVVVPLILVAKNRKHQILKLEKELSEVKANLEKQTQKTEADEKKRNLARQSRTPQNPQRGGFVRNW